MSRQGRAARKKGIVFERTIAKALRPVFPAAERHLEFQASQAKGVDLRNTGDFRIQCKKEKKYVSINTINEVQCHDWLDEVPVLVTAGDNQRAMAVLPFDDFVQLLMKCKFDKQ